MCLGPFFMQMEVDLLMKIEDRIDEISRRLSIKSSNCHEFTLVRDIIDDDEYLDLFLSSDDYYDFEMKVLNKECALNEIYAQVSRYGTRGDSHWCRIMELFGERSFKVQSKGGQFLIGNDKFKTFISNDKCLGMNQNVSHVAVFNVDDEDYKKVYRCFCKMMDRDKDHLIFGEFNIYDYSGGNIASCVEPCRTLKDGRYRIYTYDGFVAFVEY